MKYNKLVRDKIYEIIQKEGKLPITYIADDNEFYLKLREKLQEEVDEFLESGKAEELADILEVIHALSEHIGTSKEQLESIRAEKARQRGAFKEKLILKEVK